MRTKMRVVFTGLLLTLGLIAGGFTLADAGTCAASLTCTFELTVSNVPQLSPIDIRVTWINSATGTEFDVQWISGGPGTPKSIDEFGYNSSVATTAFGGNLGTSSWSSKGAGNEDGFGSFLQTNQGTSFGQSTPGVGGAITFTLASLVTSIPTNATHTEFVAHIGGYSSGCSGWVGEAGSTPGTTSTPSCGTVAEPGTVGILAFAGFGLVSAGALLRRRWFNREA